MDNTEDQPLDWAGELEHKLEGPKSVAPSTKIVGDRKIITEIQVDDEGKRKKIVSEYKLVTKRVPKAVAQRKNWKKFGQAVNDPPGPQTATTIVTEEVAMQILTGREDVMGVEPSTMTNKEKSQVTCRICGGEHWTSHCQFQGLKESEKDAIREKFLGAKSEAPVPEAMPEGGGTGKYIPPSRRAGAVMSSTGMQQDQLPSVRVSNLPTDVKEEDLRDLFEHFGKIKKVYLGKDKKTQEFKGFAFVTFYDQASADKAIISVNGHKYFHMILSVDWANPSKP